MYDMSISFTAFGEIAIIYLQIIVKRLHQRVRELIFYEKAFERLIPQGYIFKYLDTTDFFSMEIDTVEDYERVKDLKI